MAQSSSSHEFSIGHPFTVGILQVDIRLPGCTSLKEKRGRLARTMNHLRKKHAVVAAEVGDQNIWGRAGLAVVALSSDRDLVDRILGAVVQTLSREAEIELVYHEIELLNG